MAKQHSFSVTIVTDDATSDELKDSLEHMLWVIEMPTGEVLEPVGFSVAHLSTIEGKSYAMRTSKQIRQMWLDAGLDGLGER